MKLGPIRWRWSLVGLVGVVFSEGGLRAQDLLNFQESPPGSGLLVVQDSSSYAATGLANGKQYLFNAEGGDWVSLTVRTDLAANSVPRIRLADGDNVGLTTVAGNSAGRVALQSYQLPAPGVYRVTIYSDANPSAFTLQGMLGREVTLESENNDRASLADAMGSRPHATWTFRARYWIFVPCMSRQGHPRRKSIGRRS